MATLQELADLSQFDATKYSNLVDKIGEAAKIKAVAILQLATPTQAQIDWASTTLSDPLTAARKLVNYVVAANESAAQLAILDASDTTVQNNINAAVDKLTGV